MAELKKWASPTFFAESAVCHEIAAKRFFRCFGKKQTIFACKFGSCSRLYAAMWSPYLAMNARRQDQSREKW